MPSMSARAWVVCAFLPVAAVRAQPPGPAPPRTGCLLTALGDSLTHGTMDGVNNAINTQNAYLELVAQALQDQLPLVFSQPLFDESQTRQRPFVVPTNLGADGASLFTVTGQRYYKRFGTNANLVASNLLADELDPAQLSGSHEKVVFPLHFLRGGPSSTLDGVEWLLQTGTAVGGMDRAISIVWLGSNDVGLAVLGSGGSNPVVQPIPLEEVAAELSPALVLALRLAERAGVVSFEPFSAVNVARGMTEVADFVRQLHRVLDRLEAAGERPGLTTEHFLLTLPCFPMSGFLFDSEDLEFYLQKLAPSYRVPPSFARVAPPGAPIVDPNRGDRLTLLTFGLLYGLLHSGASVGEVNRVLENPDGTQRDGLVLSEAELTSVRNRVDTFNALLRQAAARRPRFHLVDVSKAFGDTLIGATPVVVGGRPISRKWIRGSGFSMDGVHPSYVGHALIANFVLDRIDATLGTASSRYDLETILQSDPYFDADGDGWAPGPTYSPVAFAELLFLYRDSDDQDPSVGVTLPPDFWARVSSALLGIATETPALRGFVERVQRLSPTELQLELRRMEGT